MKPKENGWVKPPKERKLQVFVFDPSLDLDINMAVINRMALSVPWENGLRPGPTGEYLEVVDIDPASDFVYPPVDLNDPALLAQDGLPPSEGTPQFHQQMLYAVVSRTIQNFEQALGRPVLWSPYTANGGIEYIQRLRLYPHALREANAYYSPNKKAILFGYFPAATKNAGANLPGGMVFTCLSHDIITHESTHAMLDGLHPYFSEPSNPDVLALHEAFADIVALFQHFSYPEVLRSQIARTRGNLTSENLLGELAQQFGQAIGNRAALRSAIGYWDETNVWHRLKPDPEKILNTFEPHDRGSILVAAVFDAFLSVYESRTADLLRIATGGAGILPEGNLHPDLVNRLADEAASISRHVLIMCIRALDYCPPVDMTFGEYLRAIITADYDLVPADTGGYRIAFMESFRRHGIYPSGVRSLSEESLLWRPPEDDLIREMFFSKFSRLAEMRRFADPDKANLGKRQHIFRYDIQHRKIFHDWLTQDLVAQAGPDRIKAYRETLFIYLGLADQENLRSIEHENGLPLLEVNSVRPAYRIGADGLTVADLVVEVNQRRRGYYDENHQGQVDRGEVPLDEADFTFRGGATFLISTETGEVRYVIGKRVGSDRRLQTQRNYLSNNSLGNALRLTYFGNPIADALRGNNNQVEPFALLHRFDPTREETQ